MKELILCKLLHMKLGNPRALTWGGAEPPQSLLPFHPESEILIRN